MIFSVWNLYLYHKVIVGVLWIGIFISAAINSIIFMALIWIKYPFPDPLVRLEDIEQLRPVKPVMDLLV